MIGVIGSISTDFVVTTNRVPKQGETVYGQAFETTFGGKGANQAVAAARLGGRVQMFGCVGGDQFGQETKANLARNGVDVTAIKTIEDTTTGSAHITVFEGDNAIVYVPGANQEVTVDYLKSVEADLLACTYFVIQNEIPMPSIQYLIDLADAHDIKVTYDPAPFIEIDKAYLEKVDYLLPNETEAKEMFGDQDVDALLGQYPAQLLITMGGDGIRYHDGEVAVHVPAIKGEVVDTTGAGDTFSGAFTVALSKGNSLADAIQFASIAGSLSVQKFGAQGGMPTIDALKAHEKFNDSWQV
ncbi:Ribokinase [Aerococcus viridans]|uniref:Ribokinase n=2 Tax=Aerococcus viridans TaxID=1377 RepID=A0AAU8U9S7_9LACT|nr:ribokinase [Aerococcus viridans]AMC01508.1 ribokinase [Aerococcus viridans]EFG49337.1 ribokinase [Aerococcus viridans ATCC 11563 = CCUG 4311]SUU14781.1 Ribokinase [Aerococcus viridans]